MLTSKMVKEAALAAGADICGIGSMDRFDNTPDLWNPQLMYPDAKSIICLAFRIPRGVQRGIEEGTQFFQYPSMAYGGTNQMFGPAVLYELGRMIEDEGYEAFVYRNTGARSIQSDMDGKLDILKGEKKLSSDEARQVMNQISYYPPIMHGYISSICGNACDRACYIHLEEKGVLNKKFKDKFRKRDEWVLDVK